MISQVKRMGSEMSSDFCKVTQREGAELGLESTQYQDQGVPSGQLAEGPDQNSSLINTCFMGQDGIWWYRSPSGVFQVQSCHSQTSEDHQACHSKKGALLSSLMLLRGKLRP